MKVVLASASPRRRKLIAEICDDFVFESADICERICEGISPYEICESLARQKAEWVYDKVKGEYNGAPFLVLGADTIVVYKNQILGKPQNEKHHFKMLKKLSGKTHKVITGVCILTGDKVILNHDESNVTFNKLSKGFILNYVKFGGANDKAGGYGIQDGYEIVKKYSGSYSNIVGLPMELLDELLKEFNLKGVCVRD